MDILSVLKRHGHTTYTLAKEMDIKQSTLSNMLNGNPTVKSLRLMAEKMPCSVAEFFADELTEKDLEAMLEIVRNRDNQQVVEQPKEIDQPSSALTADIAFICPHCHEAIKMGFVK
jgi:lambda repressor-like predicted transcriptional regulator